MTPLSKFPFVAILFCITGTSVANTAETCVLQRLPLALSASATCAPDRLFAAPAPYSVSVKPKLMQDALTAAKPDRQQPEALTPALVIAVDF